MTNFEVRIRYQPSDEDVWHWIIVRLATVSDTESVVASGQDEDGLLAMTNAVAALAEIQDGTRAQEANGVYLCVHCERTEPC